MRLLSITVSLALLAACNQQTTTEAPAPVSEAQPEAETLSVELMQATETGPGASVGTVQIRGGGEGAVFDLNLTGLPPGTHGFHVHANADCGPAPESGRITPAGAAGGHWDPGNTGRHAGPTGDGHLGDLPRIEVGQDGRAMLSVTAPRIDDITQLRGHALMIHSGGDNYSDEPAPLGGGGDRIACGVID
ncbi:MAG TPA: superoxide dismutase [Cu-Zn] SodC [Vitreimonas sp.]|uniref:superoxide dismutase [Cu-Zn] SodC n=1 Tax=Vitreimonas sp. TaxID=3069702 RepID=UPI002D292F0E|nr:superoxide dismutase [Cu-Zn] SodC [Vitreimonas sp.]HYD88745.1 superoxide dismutase [Cu-Zn] SodC [Vitreimonas sp.]